MSSAPQGETTELLKMFIESVHDYAVFLLDAAGNIASWNPGAQRIKGYVAEEIIGKHFSCFYSAEDIRIGKPQHGLETAARDGRFEEIGPRVRKDGSRFVAHVVITSIKDEKGIIRGFGKITRDITDRVEAEEKIKASEARLQSLVDTVLDTIVDGVVTINQQGEIQSYNKACVALFGYDADDVVGKNVRMLMPAPYTDEHDSYIANFEKTGLAMIIGIGREVEGKRKNDSTFPMELAVGATRGGGNHAFVGIIRDVSERRRAEAASDQLRQVQKMDAIGQLTGGIAHDFNNLLAVIIGNLDLMAEDAGSDDETLEFLNPCIDAALRGSELTKQLLAFGRKQSLLPKVISINDLVTRFTTLANRVLGEQIEIVEELGSDLWAVFADPGQIEDALLNLSLNARDAMPNGGKITFRTRNATLDEHDVSVDAELPPGDYVMLEIEDTGLGMAAEVVDRAFEPFFTTKEIGSGMGLSMVYGFVKQSAGHVMIDSALGAGASVKIYLPREVNTEDGLADAVSASSSSVRLDRRTVLVVEDNPNVLTLTAAMVQSLGYEVVTAVDGDAARELLLATPDIDLLLTDVMLPGRTNGPDLAQFAMTTHPNIKVLFNSGYAEQSIYERGLLKRGVNLIAKPFRKQQLAAKIEEVLLQETASP